MMSYMNNFKYSFFFFLVFLPLQLSLSGCSTMFNNQVDKINFEKEVTKPTAKKYHLKINNIERDYFLLRSHYGKNNGKANYPSKRLILVLSGSGCADEQPLLGLLYKDLPVNSDIAVLQKRGVIKNAYPSRNTRCSKLYYEHNNHANRTRDNLFLLHYLKKKSTYKKITVLGVSEGVQIIYLMMNKDTTLNEVIFLANHAANSIKGAYEEQAIFRDKTEPNTLKRFKKLLKAVIQKENKHNFVYGGYVNNWRITLNSDKKNMSEFLSKKKNIRYLFVMGDNDNLLPSEKLKETKHIFCQNKHRNNLMLYKKNSGHIVLKPPRSPIHEIIANWLDKKPYQERAEFTRLICE